MLPQWFRMFILTLMVCAFIGVIVADFKSSDYEAQATALALIGVIGAGIAADQLKKGGGDK